MAQSSLDSLSETLDNRQSQEQAATPTQEQAATPTQEQAATPSLSRRLNAKAPEFVPTRTTTDSDPSPSPQPQGMIHHHVYPNPPFHVHAPVPIHHPYPPHHHHHVPPVQYHHHHHHSHSQNHNHQRPFYGGGSGSSSFVVDKQQEVAAQPQQPAPVDPDHPVSSKNGLTDEATQKILNQVEYYFSDVNLATTDHLMRFINKDPEAYVPISVVASFKKIKALISSNSQLASILRNSGKLIVSEDGKKVRRQHPLTESDMEELQSRIVVAENLPEDHCHQNLMKIFSAVGSVKTIRTCQPQASNGGASSASRTGKTDHAIFSNKLHAFVEYESIELAEKAVVELNEEGNWRNGLKVRLLLRRTAKPTQTRSKKAGHENDAHHKEDDASTSEQHETIEKAVEDPSQQSDAQSHEHAGDEHSNEKEGGHKKGRNRGRGKGRGRSQYHHNNSRGSHVGTPNNSVNAEHPAVGKQQPPGPRMPDGTRGFSMGRGKPISATIP